LLSPCEEQDVSNKEKYRLRVKDGDIKDKDRNLTKQVLHVSYGAWKKRKSETIRHF